MKRVLSWVFLVFSLTLSSVSYADKLDEVFNVNSCSQLKSQLIAVSNTESLETVDFKYMSALECNMSILSQNMIVKMLYMMFGDFAIKSIDLTISLGSMFTSESINFYDQAQIEVNGITAFQPVIKVIQGLSYAICFLVLGLCSIFYTYYLFNSAHDGSVFGKAYNLMWTSIRLIFTILLVIPIDSFSDFTSVQVLVIMMATIGTLLANVVWFIMPIFEYLYMDDVSELKEKNEVPNKMMVSSIVDNNIKMHVCDIQARKGLYVYGLDIKDMTQENIEGSKFGSCLKNKSPDLFSQTGNEVSSIPSDIRTTKECALQDNAEKRVSVECGSIGFDRGILTAGVLTPESYLNDYQQEIRQAAYNLIGRYCVDRKLDLNKKDDAAYIKECAQVLNAEGLTYEPRFGSQVLSVYSSAPSISSIDANVQSIKNNLYNALSGSTASVLKKDLDNKQISDKIAMSLIKGWMSASSFILDLGTEYKDREIKYNSVFAAIKVNNNNQIVGADNIGTFGNYGSSGRSSFAEAISNSNRDLYAYIDSVSSTGSFIQSSEDDVSLMTQFFFPGIAELKEMNGNQKLISNRDSADSCQEDFSKCARVTLNPLVKMVRMGSSMATQAFTTSAISFGVNQLFGTIAKKFDSSTSAYIANVADLLAFLFMGYGLLGLLIAYMPAIIVFAFFVGNAIGWFVIVIQMIVISQLWVLMHLFPNRDLGFSGRAGSGYKILLDILLRPSFIVFGAFVTFIMMSIMIALLNVLFGIVLSTFTFFSNPTSVIEFITNYIVHLVYLVMIIVVIYRSGKAMYKIPNALMSWFDMHNYEDSNMWNDITGRFQTLIMKDIRKVIMFM